MEPIAVISDIHGNLEALTAVLADIDTRGIKTVLCLGDVLGYGPQPKECLDLVLSRCKITMMGNHDFAVMFQPNNFNAAAESAAYWTRQQLEEESDKEVRDRRWGFLGTLPVKVVLPADQCPLGPTVLTHGSPRRPVNEYVFPDDIYNNPNKLQGLFDRIENVCLVGHTHMPGVFLPSPDFYTPDELGGTYKLDGKALINVGSVGQPRDRDTRAGYAVLEKNLVRFIRLTYEVETTVAKVHAIRELDDYLGNRLREGR